jgi:cytochrome P450
VTLTDAVHYNPYDYGIHEDPYPTYSRLREEAPVYRNEEVGFWALSRHSDVVSAFRDTKRFSSANGVSLEPAATGPHAYRTMSFLAMDPPRHDRMRALVSRGFTPRRVTDLEPRIRDLTLAYLEPALDRREFDFVADFSGKLPMDVISEMIGVPVSDRDEVRRLADLLVHRDAGLLDVPKAGMDAAITLVGYFADMVKGRRARRTGDLTSALLEAEIDGDRLSDEEVFGFLFLMVVAGNETTAKLLANAWFYLWRDTSQREKVFGEPSLISGCVEETLRYDPSSQMVARTATTEVDIGGACIASGDTVLLLIGSANRDERVFADPDRYDVERETAASIAFGAGPHFCLGASLARLEARVALEELIRRVASYEVDPTGARRVHSVNVRGFASLPTTVEVRR